MTQKEFEREFGDLLSRIRKQTTTFPNDTTERKLARIKRAQVDKFFFAVTYFPHYIQVSEEFRECWKDPSAKRDWVAAGFAPFHAELFRTADLFDVFSIVAGFRESAKDTLLGKIDVIHKLVFGDRWFVPIIARTETKAETKVIPIRLELEENLRLKNDFGDLRGTVEWEFGSIITKTGRKVKGYGRDQSLRGEENMGHRPDYLMVNDINDPMLPDSPGQVQKYVDALKQTALKSVNSPRWGGIMLCNWTVKGDIVDEMIAGKNTAHFNKVIVRALIANEGRTREERAIAKACRDAGYKDDLKSAWESRHPTVRLLRDQKQDPDVFDAEMMMRPRSRKDQRFKDSFFRFHVREDLAGRSYVAYTFVDPSAKEAGDYKSVITIGVGLNADGMLHLPILRCSIQQQSIDDMMLETYRHRQAFRSKIVGVESNGFQILLKREYLRLQRKHGPLPFLEVTHTGESKESRIERIVPFVKEGTITFDREDPDQELLIRQLKAFPNAGNVSSGGLGDDGPDALAGAVELVEVYPRATDVGYESLGRRTAVFERGAW